jgi:tRNA threonylcarbamoyl adenosine modification protein YeaZ
VTSTTGSPDPAPAATAPGDGRRDWLLAIDTATSRVVVAAGMPDGTPLAATSWEAGYRHGQTLLPAIGRLTGEANLRRSRLRGVLVGTGPGAFTGLRVGIATAKGLVHALRLPIVGVSTGEALLAAGADAEGVPIERLALLVPAGPSDRVLVRHGTAPRLLPGGTEPDLETGAIVVAVDLTGRAPEDAVRRGARALDGLATALLRLGAARVAAGTPDDLARLVPEYVTLPRGVVASGGEVTWSRALP